MFDTKTLTAVERKVLKQYIERYELQKKIRLKKGTLPINCENVEKATLANCNGNRKIVMERQKQEAERKIPAKVLKKKEHPRIEIDEKLVQQLLKNIEARSGHKSSIKNTTVFTNVTKVTMSPENSQHGS